MTVRKTITRIASIATFTSAAFLGACTQTPAKAPDSNPEDMTPEGHRAAARQEEQKAARHEEEKENVAPSKPNTEFTQKAQHAQKAEQHRDYAEQHTRAAEVAEKK